MAKEVKKVLIIKLGAIGDVVHSTIIASAIKQKYPSCKVDFLTKNDINPLIKNHPHIDRVILFDASQRKNYKYILNLALELRKEKYDAVFRLTGSFINLILSRIISKKAVNKVTNKKLSVVEEFFYTAKKVFPDLELPEKLTLRATPSNVEKIENLIGKDNERLVILSPGGQNDRNRQGRIWPIKNWTDTAKRLREEYGAKIIVTGSSRETEYHKPLGNIEGVNVLTGKLELDETLALYSISKLVIAGDSGPLHIASGFNTNIVALFGSTNPAKYAPFGYRDAIITAKYNKNKDLDDNWGGCKFCYKKRCKKAQKQENTEASNLEIAYTPCMENISTDDVLDFIKTGKLL